YNLYVYVERALKTFDVPGLAVSIVKDGRVGLGKGYGLRNVQSGKPVGARTIFALASITGAYTAASLSMLACAGELDMGRRLIAYLPWFRMTDQFVTHVMRVRDLRALHSRLSLVAGDQPYWPPTDYTSKELIERLGHVPLKCGFRSQYF